MDLLRSHKTKPVKNVLKKNDVTLSLVPAGCTGIGQPIDISVNRPFKDMLKEEIDKELERMDKEPEEIAGSSAVGEMRVMMTKCVGAAWERFCQERREVIIRSFRCIGASLPIDGSSDGEISIKGLPTARLMTALKEWKTRGAPTAREDAASSSDDTCDSSSSDDESDDEHQPSRDATRGKPRARGVSGHGRAGHASRGRGRDRGKNLPPSSAPVIGGDSLSVPSPTVVVPAAPPSASVAPSAAHTSESFSAFLSAAARRASDSLSASISASSVLEVPRGRGGKGRRGGAAPAAPPAVGTRRSARLIGKPQRSHVISFPQITDTEGDEEDDDGVEYNFRWHADEF
jgi:hypothetical protein